MVGLDRLGRTFDRDRFDHIGIEGSLCKEADIGMFARLFIEDFDELLSDRFTLLLRIGHAGKYLHELLLGIDGNERDIKQFEHILHLLRLILTKQPLIDEDTDELLFGQRLIEHRGNDRGVYPTGDTAEYLLVPYLFTDLGDLLFGEASHVPGAFAAADMLGKVLEHHYTLLGVVHFRVELESVDISALICDRSIRRVLARTDHFKPFRQSLRTVTVAHPYRRVLLDVFEDRCGFIFDMKFRFPVLMVIGGDHLTAKVLCDQLHPVTDPKNGKTKVPNALIRVVGIFGIDRCRTAREDDPLRFSRFDILYLLTVWYNLRIDT